MVVVMVKPAKIDFFIVDERLCVHSLRLVLAQVCCDRLRLEDIIDRRWLLAQHLSRDRLLNCRFSHLSSVWIHLSTDTVVTTFAV